MSDLLQAIRAEITARRTFRDQTVERLDDELERLEVMEAEAHALGPMIDVPAPAEPAPKPDPPKTSSPPGPAKTAAPARAQGAAPAKPPASNGAGGSGELTEKQRIVLRAVNELGECSVRAAWVHLGGAESPVPYNALSVTLRELRAMDLVGHNGGKTNAARYLRLKSQQGQKIEAATKRNAQSTDAKVREVGVRSRVRDAIKKDPGALNEDRLAQALGLDREDIADACGALLEAGLIELQASGTYFPRIHNRPQGGGMSETELAAERRVLEIVERLVGAQDKELRYQLKKAGISDRDAGTAITALDLEGRIVQDDNDVWRLAKDEEVTAA